MSLRFALFLLAGCLGFVLSSTPALFRSAPAADAVAKPAAAPAKSAPMRKPPLAGSFEALRETFAMPAGAKRRDLLKQQLDALNKLAPETALDLVLQQTPGSARDDAMKAAFARLVKADLSQAVTWAEKHPGLAAIVRSELENALTAMVKKDAPGAWALLMRLRRLDPQLDGSAIVNEWMKNDPRGAVTFGLQMPEGIGRHKFLAASLHGWMEHDSKGFLAWLRTQRQEDFSQYFTKDFYRVDSKASWPDLLAVAQVLPVEAFNHNAWAYAVSEALRDEATRADAVRSLAIISDPDLRDQTCLGAILAAAKTNVAEAQTYLARITDPQVHARAFATIAANMATQDPQAAIAFASTEGNDAASGNAMRSAVGTWLMNQPDAARAYIGEHLADLDVRFVKDITRPLYRDWGAEKVLDWAVGLAASEQREAIIESLCSWINYQPENFQAWARQHAGDPGFRSLATTMLDKVDRFWRPRSIAKASVIEFMPDAAERQQAAVALMKTWRAIEPVEAARWHDAQVSAGRLTPIPVETAQAQAPKTEIRSGYTADRHDIHIDVAGNGLWADGSTTYQTYQYKANGRSFTVFY